MHRDRTWEYHEKHEQRMVSVRPLCLRVPVVDVRHRTAQPAATWPQWRGPSRDGVAEAKAPATWPATLTQKWKVAIGSGYATPIVANGRVYIHARSGEQETITAYDAATGKPLWNDAHAAPYKVNPAAASHGPGPKSSPVLANGRLYTLGISGILSCLDAASGKVIWRKQPSPEQPHFGVAMSPIVVDGLVIAFIGGHEHGALTAFDAVTGAVRWQWTGGAPAYASPILATLAGARQLITQIAHARRRRWTRRRRYFGRFPSRHPTTRTPSPLWSWATWSSTPACRTRRRP